MSVMFETEARDENSENGSFTFAHPPIPLAEKCLCGRCGQEIKTPEDGEAVEADNNEIIDLLAKYLGVHPYRIINYRGRANDSVCLCHDCLVKIEDSRHLFKFITLWKKTWMFPKKKR